MTLMKRQIGMGIIFALLLFIFFALITFFVFPFIRFSDLIHNKLFDIPIIFFIPIIIIVVGISFGIYLSLSWKKHLQLMDGLLENVERGKMIEIRKEDHFVEMNEMITKIKSIQKQMAEQVKLSQKLANEKAETEEKRIQEIIFEERNRLARELHDSVSQQLFAASMLMSAINETRDNTNERETKQLKMVEEMIHQSQLEMRALLLHLRPVPLKGKSIQEGIEELLVELSQKVSMDIKWRLEPFHVEKGVEDHLFRILQESVSNTLRHAKAKSLEVLLIQRDEFIILRVEDDGVGFDANHSKAGSYGLQNMYERALEIGGTLKIVSVKNKGTRLEVKVPVIKKGENDD